MRNVFPLQIIMPYGPHRTIERARDRKMKRAFFLTLVLAGSLSAVSLVHAQTTAGGDGAGPASSKTPDQGEKPAAGQQQATPPPGANPFPEDTSTVPVMPSKGEAVVPEGTDTGAGIPLAGDD